jgi:hypothetical protein
MFSGLRPSTEVAKGLKRDELISPLIRLADTSSVEGCLAVSFPPRLVTPRGEGREEQGQEEEEEEAKSEGETVPAEETNWGGGRNPLRIHAVRVL